MILDRQKLKNKVFVVTKLSKIGNNTRNVLFFLQLRLSFFSAKSACGLTPCQNNAICQAGFTDKGYRCMCAAGFRGQDCTEGKITVEILDIWLLALYACVPARNRMYNLATR